MTIALIKPFMRYRGWIERRTNEQMTGGGIIN